MWVNVSTDQKNMRCLLKLLHSPHIFTFHQTKTSPLVEFHTCQPCQIGIPLLQLLGVQTGKLLQVLCLGSWRIPTTKNHPNEPPRTLKQTEKNHWKMVVGKRFPYLLGNPKSQVWNVMLVSGRVFLGLCLPSNCKSINKTSCFFLSPCLKWLTL